MGCKVSENPGYEKEQDDADAQALVEIRALTSVERKNKRTENAKLEAQSREEEEKEIARLSQELQEYTKGDLDISPEKMREAIKKANEALLKYLRDRSAGLKDHMLMVPFDEGVRHFRLGNVGTDGYGLPPKELLEIADILIKGGFPAVFADEARLINATRLISLAMARPDAKLIIQHFPSGGPTLESTEKVPVHIDTPRIDAFQEAFDSGKAQGVMLAHTSYDYNEKNFPGIDALRASTPLHPSLQGVDPNTIPASLNPLMAKYMRDVMGFKGMIVPDWYDMGAIKKFVKNLDIHIPPTNGQQMAVHLKTFILAIHSGVTTIQGINPEIQYAKWEEYKTKFPKEYADLEDLMNKRIVEMFSLIKDGSTQLNIENLSFREKILFMVFNANKYKVYDFDIEPKNMPLFELVQKNGAGDYDIWSRTGVMTLLQRQFIIEKISGIRFAKPPSKNNEEEWYDKLMGNPQFRKYYDSIAWDSPAMSGWYSAISDDRMEAKESDAVARK